MSLFDYFQSNHRPWPPEEYQPMQEKMREWAAWYSGSVSKLAQVYTERLTMPYSTIGKFWQKTERQERIEKVHFPLAGDIASVSADLLFSEPPTIRIPEAQEDEASRDAKATQDRINQITGNNQTYSTLVEAAESSAALGGTYLKINWDTSFKDFPLLSVAQADAAIPTFKWGYLQEVTFFKIVKRDGSQVFRKLETHRIPENRETSIIENELYKGTDGNLGNKVGLDTLEKTEGLEPVVDTGIEDLLVRYIPNSLPNRVWREHSLGNSDYQGLVGLLDSLDETYSSLVRELRLSKIEKIVPEGWLDYNTNNDSLFYDPDKSTYTKMNMPPDEMDKPEMIQPDIRVDDYVSTIEQMTQDIITSAGYSPQYFGLNIEGRSESGTALKVREEKTQQTRDKKVRYFKSPLEDLFQLILKVDAKHFGNNEINPELEPEVELSEALKINPKEQANTLKILDQARAISTYRKVKERHPDWSEDEIQSEVERIQGEQGMAVESPTEMP